MAASRTARGGAAPGSPTSQCTISAPARASVFASRITSIAMNEAMFERREAMG